MYMFEDYTNNTRVSHRGSWYIPEEIKNAVKNGHNVVCVAHYKDDMSDAVVKHLAYHAASYAGDDSYIYSDAERPISIVEFCKFAAPWLEHTNTKRKIEFTF